MPAGDVQSCTMYKDVHLFMSLTHTLQQQEIKAGSSVLVLKDAWPFLFTASDLQTHFKILLRTELAEMPQSSLKNKKNPILHFFFFKERFYNKNIMAA